MSKLSEMISGKASKKITKILKEAFPSGNFTAKDVVNLARPKSHPLHEYFEWSDSKAAELYRITQAQTLIKCAVVMIGGAKTRSFLNVYLKEEDRRVYTTLEIAKETPDLWEQVLLQALDEAVSWKNRYENLTQLAPAITAIKKLERKYEKEKVRTKG
jgi:hypothetical protein